MPVDPTSFRTDHQLENPASRVDLPIVSPEFYRDLQVPRPVLQDLRLLSQFFSSQGARLRSLEQPEVIKASSAAIPDFEEIEGALENFQPVEIPEGQALDSLYAEVRRVLGPEGKGLGIQAAGGDLSDLLQRAERYVSEHGIPPGESAAPGDFDLLDQVFMTEVNNQKEERDEKYLKMIVAAADPESLVLLIAFKHSDYYGQKLGKAVEVYRGQINTMDQSTARLDLAGASTAEIAKANAELSKNTSYMGIASFAIQSIKQKMDQLDNTTQSILGSLQETKKQIIANFRG
ncbi:MAG: hypothetical protein HYY44_00660 [Deltaproteobacteria bacterium]|nr:hypothetical protein [Deltaproteobacteria bacterium]